MQNILWNTGIIGNQWLCKREEPVVVEHWLECPAAMKKSFFFHWEPALHDLPYSLRAGQRQELQVAIYISVETLCLRLWCADCVEESCKLTVRRHIWGQEMGSFEIHWGHPVSSVGSTLGLNSQRHCYMYIPLLAGAVVRNHFAGVVVTYNLYIYTYSYGISYGPISMLNGHLWVLSI